jgi:phosphotriesterase-related protein
MTDIIFCFYFGNKLIKNVLALIETWCPNMMKIPRTNFIAIVISMLLFGCSFTGDKNNIITVTGNIPASEMGTTLIHEHILVDFIGADKTGYHRWNREEVVSKVLPYLQEAKDHGVNTILECTPVYLGRDPQLLKMLSEKSGIQILTNTGFYGAVEDKYIPDFAFDIDADSLAAIWIKEFEKGIEETGIRPGFIKISVDTNSVLSEIDEKIVRAAIITHRKTGLTIVSHTTADGAAFAQLNLLEQEGISPRAWVWTHAQEGTPEGRRRAAQEGAWISLDSVNKEELDIFLNMIIDLKSAGLLNRVLISHDAGWFDPDEPEGGEFVGYTDIFTHLVPALKEKGFSQSEIDQLLIGNPPNAYQITKIK